MIDLNLNISNPWCDTWTILWNKSKLLSQHKAIEFNGYRTNHIVNAEFNAKPIGDHAGVRCMLGLFGYEMELHFYDVRHWDYETRSFIN
jgi:hypothetical protein